MAMNNPIKIWEIKYATNISTRERGATRRSSNEPICLLFIIDTDGLSKLSWATTIIIKPGIKNSIKDILSFDKE